VPLLRRAQGFEGDASLGDALKGCDLVIIPAGVPRKPGMTRDDLFKVSQCSSMPVYDPILLCCAPF
jgi:malate/lactate dehydrogenase